MTKPLDHNPRRAAAEYRHSRQGESETEQPSVSPPDPPRPRSEAEWRDLISHKIEEAVKNGDFDNLSGRGKPLNLDRNPYAPEGAEMAFDLLKNNNLAPAWIGERTALLRDLERWRSHVAELVRRHAGEIAAASPATLETLHQRWAGQRQALQLEAEALNKRIVNVNLQQPIAHLEILKLRLDDELRAAGGGAWS